MTKARIKGLDFKLQKSENVGFSTASSECANNLASNNNEKLKTETKARMSKLNRNMKLKGFHTSDIIREKERERFKR